MKMLIPHCDSAAAAPAENPCRKSERFASPKLTIQKASETHMKKSFPSPQGGGSARSGTPRRDPVIPSI
jgi:hypothetical protein